MKIKKRIWVRRKRLSDLHVEKDILMAKFAPPSAKTLTGIGYLYAKVFKDPQHHVTPRGLRRYEKIESLIREMEIRKKIIK